LSYTSIQETYDVFKRDDYPAKTSADGKIIHLVDINDISAQLDTMYPQGWNWEPVHAGTLANGHSFVTIKLSYPIGDTWRTVPGAADGTIGIAGLLQQALRNAVLRGANMGQSFYEKDEDPQPSLTQAPTVAYNPSTPYPSTPFPATPQTPQGGGFQPGGNAAPRNYGPWTGRLQIRSGNLMGQWWDELPDNTIMSMVNKGNNMAIKEMARRQNGGQPVQSQPQGGRPFPPTPFN
jgi:hypothetical protein